MKFYKRFPGDITIKTGDLTLVEFGAYDRLLDHYYAKEQPIDPTRVYTVARCQNAADRRAVDRVLAEFWTLTDAGWVQERADEMIAEAQPRIEAAKANGKKGGRPKSKPIQEPAGFSDGTPPVETGIASQSQNQNGSEAKASADAAAPAAVDKSTNPEPPAPDSIEAKRQLWVDAGAWLVGNGLTTGEAKAFMNTVAKDHSLLAAEAFREAIKTPAPADCRAFVQGIAKRMTGERAASNTVPSGAAEKTAEYLAERAAIVGAPPPAGLKSIRAAIAGAGLHTPEVAA